MEKDKIASLVSNQPTGPFKLRVRTPEFINKNFEAIMKEINGASSPSSQSSPNTSSSLAECHTTNLYKNLPQLPRLRPCPKNKKRLPQLILNVKPQGNHLHLTWRLRNNQQPGNVKKIQIFFTIKTGKFIGDWVRVCDLTATALPGNCCLVKGVSYVPGCRIHHFFVARAVDIDNIQGYYSDLVYVNW